MATPVKISFSGELSLGNGKKWPMRDGKILSPDDLLIFYTLANHSEHRHDDISTRRMVAAQLCKAPASESQMPRIINDFRDPTYELTQKVAELATKTQGYQTELLAAVETLYEKASEEA